MTFNEFAKEMDLVGVSVADIPLSPTPRLDFDHSGDEARVVLVVTTFARNARRFPVRITLERAS